MIKNRILELRKARGMTQKDLAKLINVSPSLITRYEKGENVEVVNFMAIADIFNVSLDYLLFRTDIAEYISTLNNEERNLIRLFRNANRKGKAEALGILLLEEQK